MRIISRSTLKAFWEKPEYKDSEQPLKEWYQEASKADWSTPNEVKAQFGSVSVIGNQRLVFNIAGNKYRLIVAAKYAFRCLYVCFIGTHKQYDKINAEEVWSNEY
ncbi:MAG: addiction module toxin RelE [Candidatus Raymondbacteria bacterium RifOxyA12_full_50_37]|uniref:Addiction module toxin RelE n=1 Tax=Candidatus Raymondbacteria bacterium RIFOXYD12_FULL_49_13 TaxID=1817890 RepID=A0A1F7FG40_UNCRA|nr:MAG: addiction module toxin RelE [Candidatus Raymondbacteria bacterium RifOxyA12_full_50_37]OGJ94286.1 MAG: addiction module toxin RelE [Candidatus Raymondbacteria bacterium RIFOXYA2_FULL_49_16]OGJ99116.1 MAG: addiction module toxin RelE [Candidatus Raymondbacteria bacterium RIFOXYC2_FULL_50_21]OGK01255.1 MAG: addiction module toxin RelE [Candidatus Raymondbacteria bacterium RifOxyB12_full_50_8]OGK05568.1 MAG: addiction module toxin RelE [Candidatus Raymondbacteria bacterium RIFOXYD12_FULL_4